MRSHNALLLNAALISGLFFAATSVAAEKGVKPGVNYGVEIPESGKIWSLSSAIGNLAVGSDGKKEKTLKISGIITKVCQKKGCWLILTDGEDFARVTFKDYETFVPTDTGTKPGLVFGILSVKELTASAAKHYASDAGESTDLVGARHEYSIVAEAILIGANI
ncbi:MAG: hypothetical protein ACI92E_003362 [Oceanicoccus sp.]|jgi:hypothetical protein